MDVDVDENDAMSRRSSQTDENDTSSFRALLKDIKNLEKQSKGKGYRHVSPTFADVRALRFSAREQQLVSKLEQQREQWEREKEQLLEQLRQKEPSVKASHR